jgi:hypothetical protein
VNDRWHHGYEPGREYWAMRIRRLNRWLVLASRRHGLAAEGPAIGPFPTSYLSYRQALNSWIVARTEPSEALFDD